MGYQMAWLPMTLSEFKGHFCCMRPLNTYNSYIKRDLTIMCLHTNYKAHVASNLSFVVKNERVQGHR